MNLYVIRNRDGEFFHAVGYAGSGDTWVDDLSKAKFYTKIGQAKARVTYFARAWPEYGVPDILEFTLDVSQARVIDMQDYASKAVDRLERRRLSGQQARTQWEIDELQRKQTEIQQRLAALKRPNP